MICKDCGKEIVENKSYARLCKKYGGDGRLFKCGCGKKFTGEKFLVSKRRKEKW